MKSLLLLALSGSAGAVHDDRLAQIRAVEGTPGVHWHAAAQPRFAEEAPGASSSLCGVKAGWKEELEAAVKRGEVKLYEAQLDAANIPEAFDSAEHWPQCAKIIDDIRDQSNCGCCWAFAGAEAASDRMCIATNGTLLLPLSAEDVCFCAESDGCDGGFVNTPWTYIQRQGAVTGGLYKESGPFQGMCKDFSLPHCHHHGPQGDDPFPAEGEPGCEGQQSPRCPKACDASAGAEHSDFSRDKLSFKGDVVSARHEKGIQEMIMLGGPVETAFTVYSDFEDYAGGIYHHVHGHAAGGHAVKMVGWGVENRVKYWKVANSWNPWWGEKGYFRIRRGHNEGGIEDQVVGSSPTAKWGAHNSPSNSIVI